MTDKAIDAIAVTVGPGLIGSLLVGVEAARSLALAWDKPLIPINHLVGHIYANFVNSTQVVEFPALVLVVSGGHTDLVLMKDHCDLTYLGGTLDDAAGEAFDKTARLLNISNYLGGVKLSQLAQTCLKNNLEGRLPRPKIHDKDNDFSFSGLKTAVKRLVEKEELPIEEVACEFETAVVDVLVKKTLRAAKEHNVSSLLLGGGVAANTQLRARLKYSFDEIGIPVHIPPLRLCVDNAIYIASVAYFKYQKEQDKSTFSTLDITADSSLNIDSKV
jgi:N6-L-threonylcarbamoyladenine synthase